MKIDIDSAKRALRPAAILLLLTAIIIFLCLVPLKQISSRQREEYSESAEQMRDEIIEKLKNLERYNAIDTFPTDEDRAELYSDYPSYVGKEDVILYTIELREKLGEYILLNEEFDISEPETLAGLTDGSSLVGVCISLAFSSPYEEVERIISAVSSSENYKASLVGISCEPDEEYNVCGELSIMLYYIEGAE